MELSFLQKDACIAIGLMSGTSADGIDAAVVELRGCGTDTKVRQLGFITLPFTDEARQKILQVAGGAPLDSREICLLNFYLGGLSADACLEACRAAGIQPGDVDFVGSHGQTIWHEPAGADYLGRKVRATLQIGEPSLIAERLGCPVVSDFRVRDMAAGGLGAPLVPYTEYLLYREEHRTVALQNIGGIGNITVLPAGGALADTLAFDTGPGNMVIDALAARVTNGALRYDDGGKLARQGQVSAELLRYLVDSDDYLRLAPPKTTGREHYSAAFVDALWRKGEELGLTGYDKIATATAFTAESIRLAVLTGGCDLGLIFDTDVDRAGAVETDGTELGRNRLIALAVAIAAEQAPGSTIVTDSVTSDQLAEFIEKKLGCRHHRFKRGYKNVINEAKRLNEVGETCLLAMETSGHGALMENYFLDDGAYLATKIVIRYAQLRRQGRTLADLLEGMREPLEARELRFRLLPEDFKAAGAAVLAALAQYAAGQPGWVPAPDNYEGLRYAVPAQKGWFLLRMSLHDPLMPLNIESDCPGGSSAILRELTPFLTAQPALDTTVLD